LLPASGLIYKSGWEKSNRLKGLFTGFGHPNVVTEIFSWVKTVCYKQKGRYGHNFEKIGIKRRKSAFLEEMNGVEKWYLSGPRLWNTETKLVSGERLNCRAS
jgi:hypothetical protein